MVEYGAQALAEELKLLDTKIAQMGGLAEQALGQAIDALHDRDPKLAELIMTNDREIDRLERSVEEFAISLIARRQPVARDLRQIIMAIRIAVDLERIGDLAKNIAKRAITVAAEHHPMQTLQGFMRIGETALHQLKNVLDAYSQRDADKAMQVWRRDEEIDAMYNSLYRELLLTMMEKPESVGLYAHLLFGVKNIERIGDHATNIAETTYFLIHGKVLAPERPTIDSTSFTLITGPVPVEKLLKA